jgi:gluconolactonase
MSIINRHMASILDTLEGEMVATGFAFTEGPVYAKDGFLYFVDIRRSRQLRWSRKTGTQVYRENTGEGNGTTIDKQGRFVICEGGNRRITRRESDGTWKVIADKVDGKRLNRPNDVVIHSNGAIYFTDPAGRLPAAERELDYAGVHMIKPDGRVAVATKECEFPNGLALSPDEKKMYVAISRLEQYCVDHKAKGGVCQRSACQKVVDGHGHCANQLIRVFDVAPDGRLTNNRVFADMSSHEDGVPDGMKVDSKGRVWCTGAGGCWVYEPDGKLIGVIKLPEVPANLAFGGPDWRDLYFTARSSIYYMRVKDPGVPVWK